REWAAARARAWELLVLALAPVAVVIGVEIAYYTPGQHTLIPEMGRYAFTAIAALAVIAIAPAFAFGRRYVTPILTGLVTAMIGFGAASMLLGLANFYS